MKKHNIIIFSIVIFLISAINISATNFITRKSSNPLNTNIELIQYKFNSIEDKCDIIEEELQKSNLMISDPKRLSQIKKNIKNK